MGKYLLNADNTNRYGSERDCILFAVFYLGF